MNIKEGNSGVNTPPPNLKLCLNGPFRLLDQQGLKVEISSKKAKALLAVLATSPDMEKTRAALQNLLWHERSKPQAQASLRRELTNLRNVFKGHMTPNLIIADKESVRLRADQIAVDALDTVSKSERPLTFLEGFDLPNESNFEDWLRETRSFIAERQGEADLNYPFRSAEGQPLSLSIWPSVNHISEAGEIFLSGVTDTFFEVLPKLRWLNIIYSPWRSNSNQNMSDEEITERLIVDYLLKCRCTEFGTVKSLTFELVQTAGLRSLWTKRFIFEKEVDAQTLTDMVREVISSISARIQTTQQLLSQNYDIPDLDVNSLIWRARWHRKRMTKIDAKLAEKIIHEAIERNPNNHEALVEKAIIDSWKLWIKQSTCDEVREARSRIQKIRDMDPFDARPHLLSGILELWLYNHKTAISLLKQAIELNPCLSRAYGHLGATYNYSGQPQLATKPLEYALRLNPMGMENFFQYNELALSYFMQENYSSAIEYCDQALSMRPKYPFAHALKIGSYFYLQDIRNYLKSRAKLDELMPDYDSNRFDWLPFEDREWVDFIKYPLNQNCPKNGNISGASDGNQILQKSPELQSRQFQDADSV